MQTQIDAKIAEFIRKMNALGITPLIDITEKEALVAFTVKEMLSSMKKTLVKAGISEDKIRIELIPFKDTQYIKIVITKK
jgi:hypothetical protein